MGGRVLRLGRALAAAQFAVALCCALLRGVGAGFGTGYGLFLGTTFALVSFGAFVSAWLGTTGARNDERAAIE